jgi:hypothetical protein
MRESTALIRFGRGNDAETVFDDLRERVIEAIAAGASRRERPRNSLGLARAL